MKVSELMSSKVEFTTPASSTKVAARQMHDQHVGALPVGRSSNARPACRGFACHVWSATGGYRH